MAVSLASSKRRRSILRKLKLVLWAIEEGHLVAVYLGIVFSMFVQKSEGEDGGDEGKECTQSPSDIMAYWVGADVTVSRIVYLEWMAYCALCLWHLPNRAKWGCGWCSQMRQGSRTAWRVREKLTLPDDAMSVKELTGICQFAVDIRADSHYYIPPVAVVEK